MSKPSIEPMFAPLQDESIYHRRARLVDIARLASLGSAICLYRLQRMQPQDKNDALTFSVQSVKNRLKAMGVYG